MSDDDRRDRPNGAARSSLRYDDFAVEVEVGRDGGYLARIVHSVAGGGANRFDLPPSLHDVDDLLEALGAEVRGSGPPRTLKPVDPRSARSKSRPVEPQRLGGELRAAVLGGRIGHAWEYHLGSLARERDRGLRLRLVFSPETLRESILASLPWELIHLGSGKGFLARSRATPLVRHLQVPHPSILPPFEPPLRILLVSSNPEGYPPLSLAEEEDDIRAGWTADLPVEIEVLREGRIDRVRERLLRGGHHVLHFMGHGEIPEEDSVDEPTGCLVLRAPGGAPDRVPATTVAESLRDLRNLRLVVLSACDTARFPRRKGRDPYSGVAAALLLAGVPAVIAMQFPISDPAALAFGRGLYRSLAARDPVDAGVSEGRLSIVQDKNDSLEWMTPVLFSRLSAGAVLESYDDASGGASSALRDRVLDFAPLIERKTRGFVGRRFLLGAIESFRAEAGQGYFELIAEPGIGKSALVAELVRRDGWVHHFNQRTTNVTRPESFLSNVCAQLALAHGLGLRDLPAEAMRDGSFLSRLLGRVSARLAPGETTVLLIDALDESSSDGLAPGVNPLYLPPSLPAGVVIVLTSRPKRPDLSLRTDCPRRALELDPDHPLNMADIREHVETFLPLPEVQVYRKLHDLAEAELVERLAEKSEGNFMYLSYILPALAEGTYRDRPIDDIPGGLRQYYEGHFSWMRGRDREVWLRETQPVIAVLAIAVDALPMELIHAYSGVHDARRVREVLSELRPFLTVETRETEKGPVEVFRIYHQTFAEFLQESPSLSIDLEATHRRMVRAHLDGRFDGSG